ncbi:MAG TPA: ROK family protein [Vicinamibacterales bacterium]|nr:ROK family protein [Vicinamibacterales bacterium]
MSRHTIGVNLSERGASAVLVDADGTAVKRAAASGAGALARVLRETAPAGVRTVGVATDGISRGELDEALGGAAGHVCSPGAAAVTAEAWVGGARGARDAVCLWIGDRVFAGVMLGGSPWLGAHGLAGSAAWLALNPVERQDYRKFGSLAAEVSNTGIARRLSWRIQSGDRSAVLEQAGDLAAITAAHVFDGARNGDGVAISVVRETAKYVGMALANLASAVDPEVVVLAGDLALAGDLLLDPVANECARRLPPAILPHFRLEFSPLGLDGVGIGAARLAALASA